MGLRKGKMLHGQRKKSREGKREQVRNYPMNTKVREERRCAPGVGVEISL